MIITCPHCKKQHNIDEKRIPPNVKMARCQGCGQQFPLDIPREEPAPPPLPKPIPVEIAPIPAASDAAPRGTQETRRIGVSLSKGGVGKTTTSVNLAAGLALAGKKVLLVDTDTQGQSSFMLGVKPKGGLTELVTGELPPEEAIIQARKNLWILAGGKSLAGLKRLIDRKDYGGELTIAQALTPLEKDYDYVVVDTSPGWDPLTVNVLFYVNELMTPVSLEVMSIQGFGEFLKSIASIQKFRKEVELRYILPTFRDMRVKSGSEFLEEIEKIYGDKVCAPIRYNVRLSEAPAYGQTIFEFAPGSNGAQDYRDLVRKVTGEPDLFT
ncbi:AAA family ATPase [Thiovibrio frasassiensis]|uniref:Zinc-ribbon domain-containing protein n=1 Tax=Thiovibrio frasassiensis TaxID=2984131 RepID=A0A9X4MGU0_9BACT|nr:AAA family ATPase [Thiovibrio frasassiensis]MDG4475258.1 zinc-ribbon domain-containing protein [Thiovibrio frasassiensis]